MHLLCSILCFAIHLGQINAFVPWRPDISHLDPATLHDIQPPSVSVRRHESRISNAEAKFKRRASHSPSSNIRPGTQLAGPLSRRQDKTTGRIPLSSDPNDISYWIDLQVGSSKKSFRMVLDTGSADTWIPSSACTSQSCLAHRTHGPADSSTLEFTGNETFSLKYASGNVEGTVVKDSFKFGSVTLDDVEFGLATTVSDDFTGFPVDGILGLGFPSASVQKVPTFLDNLISHQIIARRVFGVYLHRTGDNTANGSVIFGGVDNVRIEGGSTALKYYGLNRTSDLWSIRMDDVLVDGKNVGFDGGRNVVIDTGTALILIPPDDALKIHQSIAGTQSNGQTFYIPCNTNVSLELVFGGDKYAISSKDYVGDVVNATSNLCLSLIVGKSVVRDGAWLIGDVFLRNVYSVFDMDEHRIGFGKVAAAPNPDPTGTSTRASPQTSPLPSSSSTVDPRSPPPITRTIIRDTSLSVSAASNHSPTSTTKVAGEFDSNGKTGSTSPVAAAATSSLAANQNTTKPNDSSDRCSPNVYRTLFPLLAAGIFAYTWL
ncbi:hypothetical protein TWF696_009885 [Orbilia brochopaga]|uniref:Peptidase A1 domain-containing protein n=1 Tax=Orbilia brochopaga TaxID=3140254 RepID=A0AAV9UGZ4_9PEZI